ncbi:SPW repeat protein [Streptomyces sp. HU2014]|uniref:Membrane protein n=1 Tax=Streptomyces albireticuli TaxID=1940 RepID=A0A1Z2LAC7_9ACTN|nr:MULTISPECIES: SPW repeat protein [Streptomyces]ARZ71255.1 membrane protein [Streptomyces albireticuli]UQI44737.1 SPW repeat protein [Streptomyces sp. HU2014]
MTAPTSPRIDQHPDIVALRAHSEETTATPVAQAVEALALLCGVYLAASAWIVGFSGSTTLAVNNLIVGVAFACLVSGFGPAYERTHAMSWAALALGAWTIVSPWIVAGHDFATRAVVSNVVVGVVACLVALALAGMGRMRARR